MSTQLANQPDWAHTRSKFIEAGGSTTQSLGLGRLVGQIYALLYLSPQPICLEEIAEQLGVSKASISVTIRQMERWAAVHKVWVKGDRRDFYEAETDFRKIFRDGFLETLQKKLHTAGRHLEQVETQAKQSMADQAPATPDSAAMKTVTERLERARKFQRQLSGLIDNPLINRLL
jgi:DNA-binding transcriptional regulator GbsR (MarR family)